MVNYLLWGLSADVAGRTLSNLQGTKATGPVPRSF
jgi:hypothetical protein